MENNNNKYAAPPMTPNESWSEKDIFKYALDKWGEKAQTDMVIEECSELIKSILKFRRNPCQKTFDDVSDEITDVEIMVDQLKEIMNNHSQVKTIRTIKMKRLIERLNK